MLSDLIILKTCAQELASAMLADSRLVLSCGLQLVVVESRGKIQGASGGKAEALREPRLFSVVTAVRTGKSRNREAQSNMLSVVSTP